MRSWLAKVDKHLIAALITGMMVRQLPHLLWGLGGCLRDECAYISLSKRIIAGEGFDPWEGWLWAPGQPFLMAAVGFLFGDPEGTKILQVYLGALLIPAIYWVTLQLGDRKAARIAAWMAVFHPSLVYFSGRLWSEALYATLLMTAVGTLLWARRGAWQRALLTGFLVGVCVLFRGVATYMAPIFVVAALWPEEGVSLELLQAGVRERWKHGLALFAAVVLTVAPWSVWISTRFDGLIVSDATVGQMMWLGNGEHPPMTFDVANGMNMVPTMEKWTANTREHCDVAMQPPAWNRCEVNHAKAWIREHPREFVERIPLRVAQLVNPNSFLTRHIRWSKWTPMPFWLKELLCVFTALTTYVVLAGGTVASTT